ncbi:MAG: DNA helicase RecQ [Deltaproteobacteria bacterium]|nr:DNA helicase RecQ [Deltaproteobacteria bacterium]
MVPGPKQILKDVFGYEAFRPLQADIIDHVLKKKETLVIMPTGSGKSLCYQIPALIFPGLTIVISPLISLMKDQVEQLAQMGAPVTLLNSALPLPQYRKNVRRVMHGDLKLLYMAPEALLKPNMLTMLSSVDVDCITIDEAHCISEWGHDFRPEYRQLVEVRDRFPNAACIALTATATPRVREDIKKNLGFENAGEFVTSFNRENLFIRIEAKYSPLDQVKECIGKYPDQSGIIYCHSRRQVDDLYEALKEEGYSVKPYHAGLSETARNRNQELFIRDDVQIIVATIAFGMGIDKPNVRFVIHFDLPKNIETYYQEIGRAGRDSLKSDCLLLFSYGDIHKIKHLINQKEGHEKRLANIHLNTLLGFIETEVCRRVPLLAYFGETYAAPKCHMCDNCLIEERDLKDITIEAQKFLSCAKRTREMFGAGHLVDVLRGSKAKKVLKFGHQHLSTYGIGTDYSRKQWFRLSRQFIQKGLLVQDLEFGSLKLTDKAWRVLKGGEKVLGMLQAEKVAEPLVADGEREHDRELFEILRKERKRLADTADVPPYVIFSDKTLMEMATHFPQTREGLIGVYGVGAAKCEKYGLIFLHIIREYCGSRRIDEIPGVKTRMEQGVPTRKKRHEVIGENYNAGQPLHEIMDDFGIKRDTLLNHLFKYLQEGHALRPDEFLAFSTIPEEQQKRVLDHFARQGAAFLGPVFHALDGEIDYEDLKILRLYYLAKKNENQAGDTKNFPSDALPEQIICLANSRKYSGRCVAGKTFSGNRIGGWVRPVSSRETGELTIKETSCKDGKPPGLMDIVSVPLIRHRPRSYQQENYLVDGGRWVRKGQLPPSELPRLCDPVDRLWINGFHSYNGFNDRMPLEMVENNLKSSLRLIQPENVRITVSEGVDLLKKVRMRFTFAGTDYWLTITDSLIESTFFQGDIGEYPITKKDLYLTVSIGEPYQGFCYKLVAAVFNFL